MFLSYSFKFGGRTILASAEYALLFVRLLHASASNEKGDEKTK